MSPKQQDRSDRPKHIPIVTAQTAFTIPSPTSSSLSEQFSPWFTVSNSLMTPPLSRTTTNSAGPTTIQHELSAQRSFHHTETTSPTHNSRGASSSFGHSTHSSRSQIYGQPPAAMVSPVIPRKVTGEHLSLTSFPPVSKEDIAKLPKEIEPTLPSPDMSPFASRHHSRQTSLRHLSSNSPSAEAFPGLSPQMRTSNPDTNNEDGRAFNLSAPPSAHQRPACYTYPIHTGESARKSAETKIAANFTALARIQEDNVTMIGSSFENPRPAPRPTSSSQAAAHRIPKPVVTQSMAKLKSYFAICTLESIHAARIAISSEEERLERVCEPGKTCFTRFADHSIQLALIRHLTGTADGDVPNRRPRNPNHGRQYYARNLWCTHHTQSCSLCDAACCVMMEVVEVESETTDIYCKNLAKEAGDIIEACAQPSDAPTFLQCGECCRIVCPECIGECPVETCMLMACKVGFPMSIFTWIETDTLQYCKPTPWEPCSVHNLI